MPPATLLVDLLLLLTMPTENSSSSSVANSPSSFESLLRPNNLASVELVERARFGRGISSRPRCTEMVSGSRKAPASTSSTYSGVCSDAFVGLRYSLIISEEQTTDTELAAMAADAIQGSSVNPNGVKIPAARGIPSRLYMLANRKLR
uniref:Putative secreted protein n=1 Tax=Anopheles darlingi TaxID=43151 RepID=A0A2M4DFU7_ANODA